MTGRPRPNTPTVPEPGVVVRLLVFDWCASGHSRSALPLPTSGRGRPGHRSRWPYPLGTVIEGAVALVSERGTPLYLLGPITVPSSSRGVLEVDRRPGHRDRPDPDPGSPENARREFQCKFRDSAEASMVRSRAEARSSSRRGAGNYNQARDAFEPRAIRCWPSSSRSSMRTTTDTVLGTGRDAVRGGASAARPVRHHRPARDIRRHERGQPSQEKTVQ